MPSGIKIPPGLYETGRMSREECKKLRDRYFRGEITLEQVQREIYNKLTEQPQFIFPEKEKIVLS